MMKLHKVSGLDKMCGINVSGREFVEYLVENWESLLFPFMEVNLY